MRTLPPQDEDISPWWARVFWGGVFVGGAYLVTSGFSWQSPEPKPPEPEVRTTVEPPPVPVRQAQEAPTPAQRVKEPPPSVEQMSMEQLSERIAQLEKTLASLKEVTVPEQGGLPATRRSDSRNAPSAEESARALQEILAKQQLDAGRGQGDRDREILKQVDQRSAEVAQDLRSQIRAFEVERQKLLDQVIEDAK